MAQKALVVTMQGTLNYGAELQAMAMQQIFSQYFSEVWILCYRPGYLMSPYKLIDFTRFRGFVATLLNLPTALIKKINFSRFRKKHMHFTSMYSQIKDVNSIGVSVDWIILGSDQIWNLQINKEGDPVFFGMFKDVNATVMAFSASIGNDAVTEVEKSIYKERMKNVDYIAVREKQARSILQESGISKPIDITIDPTLIIPAKEWQKLEKKIRVPNEYVLIYSLNKYEETYRTAYDVSNKMRIPVIEVLGNNIDFLNIPSHRMITTAGPGEFLYLFNHASYIVTDSFHGAAFSVIFQKEFLVVPHKTRGARMIELLRRLGLEKRIISGENREIDQCEIDWIKVSEILEQEVNHSESYIVNCLNERRSTFE